MSTETSAVALVGRPNVGKSTLFNRLCRSRDALVHNEPGLTRDRRYGTAHLDSGAVTVIDTGGLFETSEVGNLVTNQVHRAIEEADLVFFLIDAQTGTTPVDENIAEFLRKQNVPVVLVANKVDGLRQDHRFALNELVTFGFGEPLLVSAVHGHGLQDIHDTVAVRLTITEAQPELTGIPVAVVGRPNVGKSTLINSILGNERCVVFDEPGTTRDSVFVPFKRGEQEFTLIDTAGIRRKGRVTESVEKFSVVKALNALDYAEVALLVIDATEGLVEQDLHIVSYAEQAGTGLILVVNKWDSVDSYERERCKQAIQRRLTFATWIPVRYVSALSNFGCQKLLDETQKVHRTGAFEVSTGMLNRVLQQAVERNPPGSVRGHPIKLRYVHKVGAYPPTVIVHGNQTNAIPASYIRYLEKVFRNAFRLYGMPVNVLFRKTDNPFEGKRNRLTPRQETHRKRLIRHRKARSK